MKLSTAARLLAATAPGYLMTASLLAGPPCEIPVVQTSPMQAVNAALDFALEDREVVMAADAASGVVVTAWAVNQTLGTDYDLFFTRSADGGATWSAPAALNSNASTDTVADQLPSIACGGGTFIAVWQSTSGAGTDLDIRFSRSVDGGQTWSAIAPLNTNAGSDASNDHDRTPRIATDGDGTWICVWDSNDPSSGTTGFDQDVFFSKSVDDGQTWSPPMLVDPGGATDTGFDGNAVVASNGIDQWVVAWSINGMRVFQSDNDGTLWTFSSNIDVGQGPVFLEVAGYPGGNWLIAATKNAPDTDTYIYRSVDGGLTWSSPIRPVPNVTVDANDDEHPSVAFDATGMATVAWGSDERFGGGLGFDREIIMCASSDFGLTWGPPTSINGGVLDSQFADEEPSVVALGGGNWLVAWKSTNALNGTIGTDYDVMVANAQVLTDADCNNNSVNDGCEIMSLPANDRNNDGIMEVCQPVSFPNASLTEVLRTGDPAPAGGVYGASFGMPRCKGSTEEIIFQPDVPNIGAAFVLNETGVDTILVARGDAAPGTPAGVVFSTIGTTFGQFDINAQQQVAFEGFLTGPGVEFNNRTGVWLASTGGVTFVARGAEQAPGFPPGILLVTSDGITQPCIGDIGNVALRMDLVGPGVTSANDRALWRWQSGSLDLVAREGDFAPGTGLTFLSPGGYDFDSAGTMYFSAGLNTGGNPNSVWSLASRATTPIAVALPGQAAPGLPAGVIFQSVGLGLVASNGTLTLSVTLQGPGVTTANDSTFWTWKSGTYTLIVREGDAPPGTTGLAWTSVGLGTRAISPNGRVVMSGRSTGSAGTDEAFYLVTPDGLETIIRTWTPAPGTFPPTFFDYPISGNYTLAVNDNGDVMIGSEGGVFGWRENYGLFFVASDGASAEIDGQTQPITDAYLPARTSSSTGPSRNLANDGSFVFRAIYPEPPLSAWAFIHGTLPPLADLDGDTCVTINDLLTVINGWGPCTTTPCRGDCTHDGLVNIDDLLEVINNWGCDET